MSWTAVLIGLLISMYAPWLGIPVIIIAIIYLIAKFK
jgi:hypothetical protein